jgi:alpha-tubulin suppressor-like RCC1 family protein
MKPCNPRLLTLCLAAIGLAECRCPHQPSRSSDGSSPPPAAMTAKPSLSKPKQLAAGDHQTYLLYEDGSVYVWGDRYAMCEVEGTCADHAVTPGPVRGLHLSQPVQRLEAAASDSACVVFRSHDIQCWGYAGGGYAVRPDVPLHGVAQVTVSQSCRCAVFLDGGIGCWGYNEHGALGVPGLPKGEGIHENRPPPLADVGGPVIEASSGGEFTCVLSRSGHVRCWGANSRGQLGYGHKRDIGDDETPASAGDVRIGVKPSHLTLGGAHACVLTEDGRVRCWGYGGHGGLGYGNPNDIGDDENPEKAGDVPVGGRVVQLDAGFAHTCALLDTGRIRCWGANDCGQLGYGHQRNVGDDETPASVGDVDVGEPAVMVSAGVNHTCSLLASGQVRCWGNNDAGQLGYFDHPCPYPCNPVGATMSPVHGRPVPLPQASP